MPHLPLPTTLLTLILVALPVTAWAQDPGQEDLDQAASKRIKASTMADLEKVVELAESAIEKGLDEPNTKIAEAIITATLFQHGSRFAQALFNPQERTERPEMLKQFALRDLNKILKYDDTNPKVYMMIARLESVDATGRGMIRPSDLKRGKEAADRAIELLAEDKPMLSKALILRAGYLRGEAQMADINRAIQVDPNNSDAWRLRGKSRLVQGELLAAKGQLDEATKLRQEALDDFNTLLEKNADDGDALQAVAELMGRLGNYEEAIAKATMAIQRRPRSANLFRLRARLYRSQEQYEDAIRDLNRSIDLRPDNFLPFLDRANVNFDKGDKRAAGKDYGKARELIDDLGTGRASSALTRTILQTIIIQSQSNTDNVIKELSRYVEIDEINAEQEDRTPTAEFRVELGRSYLFADKPVESVETLTVLLDRFTQKEKNRHRQSALRIRGDAYLGLGKHAEAITDYRSAQEITPRDDGVLNNLAWVLATSPKDELRDAEEAIKLATEACRLTDYEKAHILSTLAAAHAESGNFERAIEISTQAVELSKKDEESSEETQQQLQNELESYKQNKPWRELQDALNKENEVSGPAEDQPNKKPSNETATSTEEKASDEQVGDGDDDRESGSAE